jgi:hypothetical protein
VKKIGVCPKLYTNLHFAILKYLIWTKVVMPVHHITHNSPLHLRAGRNDSGVYNLTKPAPNPVTQCENGPDVISLSRSNDTLMPSCSN